MYVNPKKKVWKKGERRNEAFSEIGSCIPDCFLSVYRMQCACSADRTCKDTRKYSRFRNSLRPVAGT